MINIETGDPVQRLLTQDIESLSVISDLVSFKHLTCNSGAWIFARVKSSGYILALDNIGGERSNLYGIWDTISNKGYLVDTNIFTGLVDYDLVIPSRNFNPYNIELVGSPESIESRSFHLLTSMLQSKNYSHLSNEMLVIKSVKLAKLFNSAMEALNKER